MKNAICLKQLGLVAVEQEDVNLVYNTIQNDPCDLND